MFNKMTTEQFAAIVDTKVKEIIQTFGLDSNLDARIDIFAASNDLYPLCMAIASHSQIRISDVISNADVLFLREEDPDRESWEVTIKEYDLVTINIPEVALFPWQEDPSFVPYNQKMLEEATYDLLSYLPDDEKREGLLETPKRVAKAWKHWTSGYDIDIKQLLKTFKDGAESADEMVIVRNIPIYSKCEHHLADIIGSADIAYIPNGKVVGLSKLSRVADAFARRLQVQERLTNQIADALWEHLEPKGVAVRIRARHMCMESRGICQQGHHTETSALRGVFKEDSKCRAEFMALVTSPIGV